ncbi:MAG: RNA-binding S4 domain-containing protein [Pseudomonadota bacterium]|nr:RNA-binding S4 domain-containing protein [Pseudomonadota bacterium]
MTDDSPQKQSVRIDKWLWAARFFKTRSIATDAVEGGKIKLHGERPKPAKAIKTGDQLEVRSGPFTFEITVLALSDRRGPASEAAKLYFESETSKAARHLLSEQLRGNAASAPLLRGRPTKKARRDIARFTDDGDDT